MKDPPLPWTRVPESSRAVRLWLFPPGHQCQKPGDGRASPTGQGADRRKAEGGGWSAARELTLGTWGRAWGQAPSVARLLAAD